MKQHSLIFTTLLANSVDVKLMTVFLFFTENRIRQFMQIVSNVVSNGDKLHEMLNPIFWKKNKKNIIYLSSAELASSGKG